jgi:hypothetical protein
LGFKFANEQFAGNEHGTPMKIGNLTKESFEREMPTAVHIMLCANIRLAYIREANKYQNSLHEQRARLVQDVFTHLIKSNDIADRPEGTTIAARDFNNGKVLIPNIGKKNLVVSRQLAPLYADKEGLVVRPDPPAPKINKPSDTVDVTAGQPTRRLSLPSTSPATDQAKQKSKDFSGTFNNITMQQSLARMRSIQGLQQDATESQLNIKESGGIPDGYMPSHDYDEVVDRTTNDDSDTNSGDRERDRDAGKKLQARSTGQSNRQAGGETSRLTSKDDLASMPEQKENSEPPLSKTPESAQPAMQPAYDAAAKLEAFRLQSESRRITPKKPISDL